MATNQTVGGGGSGGFDMSKLLKPPSNPMNMIPNSTNLTTSPSFPTSPPSSPSPYLTPSSSFPPPTGPFPFPYYHIAPAPQPPQHQHFRHQQNMNNRPPHILYPQQIPQQQQPNPNPNPNSSASPSQTTSANVLMAFFTNQNQNQNLTQTSDSTASIPSVPPVRLRSSKVPTGRHLIGNHAVYDIDVRQQGEVQPQLEVTPITKYISDPGLVLGRQIAVNRNYICYGLKLGNIRILNIITAMRSLLRGHTQRVTDMAFFAEDVHLLASASVDGRFFIWNITEGPDEEEKPPILGKVVVAIQILADGESVHPRVCWHPHKQEILMVAIGNWILKIDSNRVGKGEQFSAEEPLKCPIDDLINGVQCVGKHDGEITELSMCQWLTTRLASASLDGTVKIWDDRKSTPLAVLRPYDGQPVNSVTFLIGPRPQHIVLVTGGPLNRETKIWASAGEEGWVLPSDVESWKCSQTLELKSSADRHEDAFFNQVVALNRANLFLLANAKKNAIYAVHLDYGPNPATTRMDYIAEFTVTMPILSLTGTSDGSPDGEHVVQVYCVQTQAIQQYALDLSQCLPPPLDNTELEKKNSNATRALDTANTDVSANLESSHGRKSANMPVGTSTLVRPILSSSTESVPVASSPKSLPSSEITTLAENASGAETKLRALASNNAENINYASSPLSSSPRLARKSSGFRSPSNSFEPYPSSNELGGEQSVTDYSVDNRTNTAKEKMADVPSSGDNLWNGDRNIGQNDISTVPDFPVVFKHPTHLVTPSEILSTATSLSENTQFSQRMNVGEAKVQDVIVNNDAEGIEVEAKVVGETGGQTNEFSTPRESHVTVAEKKEKSFHSQASDLSIQVARDCCVGTYNVDGIRQVSDVSVTVVPDNPSNNGEVEEEDLPKDAPAKVGVSEAPMVITQSPFPATKGKKQKGKHSQISGTVSPSQSPYNSTDSSNEQACSSGGPSTDTMSQLSAVQDMLDQLMNMQKEMQKQMNALVSSPVNKEGKRLEASLGRSIEKLIKSNTEALWARCQEDNAKHEKLERDRMQQITNLITNTINKDLPAVFEKTLKKEITAVGPAVARAISPNMEKSISSAITESFQKGVGEKVVNQLEKLVGSKVEATVARQIQAQFQTSGKQALQDALRSSLESSIIPAFETSCKAMFEQIDSTFQKGLIKHTTTVQQQFETAHSPLTMALRDAINSATSVTQTLNGELADGHRKLLAIAAAGANSKTVNPLVTQSSNGPMVGLHEKVEPPLDPTKELSRLIAECKYEEAFTGALHRSDVSIVSWLCSQVDLQAILVKVPIPLSQGVLLALLQQLACDISKETPRKLTWMTDVAVAINPTDPMIAMHVRPIFEQVYQILGHQRNLPTTSASEANSIRLLMHVINSVLVSCK